jgi:hypothetical protein
MAKRKRLTTASGRALGGNQNSIGSVSVRAWTLSHCAATAPESEIGHLQLPGTVAIRRRAKLRAVIIQGH